MSRDRILADIRRALAVPGPPPSHHPHPVWPRSPAVQPAALAERFQARFEALGGRWGTAADPGALDRAVVAIAREAGGAVLVARDPDGDLDRLGVADGLVRAGLSVARELGPGVDPNGLGLAITTATCAIAETGSFGLIVTPGQGRLASVIAPVHLTILRPAQIVPDVASFLEAAGPALGSGAASAAILVTGPSRTGDIEGQLIVGVHGPRQVHCLLFG